MKQVQSSIGCLWPIGGGFAGLLLGLMLGSLAEYLDDYRNIYLPGLLIGPSMLAGGLLGVAFGYIAVLLHKLRKVDNRKSR